MKKIIPFKKEIMFQNTIEEIISISMDHHLSREEYHINGNFVIEGEYVGVGKKDKFHFDIPYVGEIDQDYKVEDAILDIDDFYYEIAEPNKLSIHIDILVDKLIEKPLLEEEIENIPILEESRKEDEISMEEKEVVDVVDLKKEEKEERVEDVSQVFSNQNEMEESYMTYKVYIVREGDTINTILEKYQITEEKLKKYNVINELTLGDKLIIPNEKN